MFIIIRKKTHITASENYIMGGGRSPLFTITTYLIRKYISNFTNPNL